MGGKKMKRLRATVSVTLGAFREPSLVRPIRERIWRSTRVGVVGYGRLAGV